MDTLQTFLKWTHEHGFVTNLQRPKNINGTGLDYFIQLKLKSDYPVLVARRTTLIEAINEVKRQLMAILPVKK